jgi:GDP-L-fucose synthase
MTKIIVTGADGFLGRHLLPILKSHYSTYSVQPLTRSNYDLLDPSQVDALFHDLKPEVVVHLAAYSGGIGANVCNPADFYHRNILLMSLMFRAAAEHGVTKLIYPMGGCSYPANAHSPIDESQMWNGYPQKESAAYSSAKKMGIVASTAYRQQYGLNSAVLIPGNMYGEYDNFRESESHVIPAMIRRFYEAKLRGDQEIVLWGSGQPVRDFVYAGDVAALIPYFIDNYDTSEPINISSGTTTSIHQLAELAAEAAGFRGTIRWDTSKPDGQMVKIFSVERLRSLGLSCSTSLKTGLEKTVHWFAENYDDRTDGLRL